MGGSELELVDDQRFRVIRPIGEGGMGVVYEAEDLQRSQLVAIKALKHQDLETLYRLKREFRSLADVSHPNLVDLYDMVVGEDSGFFTMELVEGGNVVEYCRPGSSGHKPQSAETVPHASGVFDEGRVRMVLPQLARGLSALHERGMVHRDIKPSNVLVTHSGRVVLLDFGLVTNLRDWNTDSLDGRIVGTIEYMAPEQVGVQRVAPSADWYGVGVLMYEILTGCVPYQGPVMKVLMDKQELPPVVPSQLVEAVPEDLESLCLDLMNPDPTARPTGEEVLERLGVSEPSADHPSVSLVTELTPLTGRDKQLRQLRAALARAEAGQPASVMVRGPSGIGKTALLRHFLDEIRRDDGAVIFEGRCYPSEVVPYNSMDAVIDQLTRYWSALDAGEAAELLPGNAPLLPVLFPMLGRVPAIAGAPLPPDQIDPHQVQADATAALRLVFRRLAVKRTLILFLDDLQWADLASLKLLADLMRAPGTPAVLLVMSTRDDALDTPDSQKFTAIGSTALDGFLQVLSPHLDLIELGPLDKAASVELARHMLRGEPAESIERVAEEAGGIPFFIAELAFYVQTVEPPDSGPVRLHQVLEARIKGLPDSARELIELAAVAGAPISQRVASSAMGGSSELLARVIRHLRTAHLLRAPGGRATDRVECYHNRIRESVRGSLSPERKVACHRALAIAFEQWSEGTPERLSRHWEGAGDVRRASTYARRAADEAAAIFDFARAARLFERALALGEFPAEDERQLRADLAAALDHAGRQVEAAQAYIAAAEGTDQARALELRAHSAVSLLRGGYYEQGMAAVTDVLSEMGIELAPSVGRAWVSLLFRRLWLRVRSRLWRRRDAADIPARRLTELDVCASVTMALGMIDAVIGVEFQSRHMLMALRVGEPGRVAYAFAVDGAYLTVRGKYDQAEIALRRAETMATELGDDFPLTVVAWGRGALKFFRDSDFEAALGQFRAAEALLRRLNLAGSWEMVTIQHYIFLCRYFLGQLSELIDKVPRYAEAADRRGDVYAVVNMSSRFLLAWLASGGSEAAQKALDGARSAWGKIEGRLQLQHLWMYVADVELALYRGDFDVARQLVIDHRKAIAQSMLAKSPRLAFLVTYTAAKVAAACGDRAMLQASARQLARGGRLSLALCSVIASWLAQIDGDDETAIARLETGIDALDALSANIYAVPARRALGELLGGERGGALIREADDWLATQGVAEPSKLARILVPVVRRESG